MLVLLIIKTILAFGNRSQVQTLLYGHVSKGLETNKFKNLIG